MSFDKLCKQGVESLPKEAFFKGAEIYAYLKKQGTLIEDADIFIAAYCITTETTLITNNPRKIS